MAAVGVAAVALPAVAAVPAGAWVERYSFDDIPAATSPTPASNTAYAARGLALGPGCGQYRIGGYGPSPFGPRSGSQVLQIGGVIDCDDPSFTLGFNNAPHTVQFWVRSPVMPRQILSTDLATNKTSDLLPGTWTRVLWTRSDSSMSGIFLGAASGGHFVIDDIATSDQLPAPPPATLIDSAPPASTTSTTATVAFHNTDPGPSFTCQLDSGAITGCGSPHTRTGLAVGPHTLKIRATGLFGMQEAAARQVSWTVTAPPTPAPSATPTTSATPAPTLRPQQPLTQPECLSGGPDTDRDGIPDLCDTVGLPGTVPPTSGETTNVKVTSGTVFIKLPAGNTGRAQRLALLGTRAATSAPAPGEGFVPLKGDATVPVGATVDARAGSISITSATAASSGSTAAPTASAKISAAIFQIRQARAKRHQHGSKRKLPPNPTSLLLRTPQGSTAQCAQHRSGEIRAITAVVPKGSFQFVGAAATVSTTTKTANVRAVDRCDGTFVQVGRGVAKVTTLHTKPQRTVTVRSGRGYLVKGNFLELEGRKGV